MNIGNAIIQTMESETMKEYLLKKSGSLRTEELVEMVCGAPLDLSEKKNLLLGLMQEPVSCEETVLSEIKEKVEEAIDDLKLRPGEIFLVEDCWYDEDFAGENSGLLGLFQNLDAALEGIQQDIAENTEADEDDKTDEEAEEPLWWYELQKWIPDVDGKLRKKVSYIFAKGKIMFFEYFEPMVLREDFKNEVWKCSTHLNLMTPFETGDLIRIDCRPFAPMKNVLIVENYPNFDCCGLQALFVKKGAEETEMGAVKHSNLFEGHYRPLLSPLYRAEILKKGVDKEEFLRTGGKIGENDEHPCERHLLD